MSIQVRSLSCLEANCANSLRPKKLSEYATPHSWAANTPLKKLRKALKDCKIAKEPPGFGPKMSESSGNHKDCTYRLQINWTRTSLNRHAWKLVDLDWTIVWSLKQFLAVCSRTAKTPRCGLKIVGSFRNCWGCVPKLQNALENSTICMQYLPNSARNPTIVLTKCKSLYPRQLAQEMWGCSLHAFLPTATTEKYSQSYRPYREIFLGN